MKRDIPGKKLYFRLLLGLVGLFIVSCNSNNSGSGVTPPVATPKLVVDAVSPVPIINSQVSYYSVYIKNIGTSNISGLKFGITSSTTSTYPTISGGDCSTIAANSTCIIDIMAVSAGNTKISGSINGKEVVSFSTFTYPLTLPLNSNESNSLVLASYPSVMELQSNTNGDNYFGAMSFSVINTYNTSVDVTNLLGKLPTNVHWSPINCINPLPSGEACQVRLTYTGAITNDITVNLNPSGEIINHDGTKTPLPIQNSKANIVITKDKISGINPSYIALPFLNGNSPSTNNSIIGYITNSSTNSALISSITVSNDSGNIFSISDNSCTGQLRAGNTCQYTITANVSKLSNTPSGSYNESIAVAYNNGVTTTQTNSQLNYSYIAESSSPYFVGYYPTGCTVNDSAAGIVGTCVCIEDPMANSDGSHNIWYADGSQMGTWYDWAENGTALAKFNSTSHCGETPGGWHLPSAPNAQQGYMNSTNPGGEWGSIATASGMNGNAFAIGIWMNNNGFVNIYPGGSLWTNQSESNNNSFAWGVDMIFGIVSTYDKANAGFSEVILVRKVQ